MKRVLFLGASWFQMPPLAYARARGHMVFTCDNRPDNPGHALAHRTFTVSTIDRHEVLALARELAIDGIVAYASDVSAPTAAFVAEQLELPGNPLPAVEILTDKHLFRSWMRSQGLAPPEFFAASDPEDLRRAGLRLGLPLVVKPVDSSGSKGVTVVQKESELDEALRRALAHSRARRVIIERFLRKTGMQLTGDGLLVDGRIAAHCFVNQHLSGLGEPCYPVGESWPPAFAERIMTKVVDRVQEVLALVGLRMGAFNIDVLVDAAETVHVLEIGPRSGGNGLPALIEAATGIDLVAAVVDAAVGDLTALPRATRAMPHGSWNLVDQLHGNGFAAAGNPVSIHLAPAVLRAVVAAQITLRDGRQIALPRDGTFTLGPLLPGDLSVGWLLLQAADPRALLDAMDDLVVIAPA